MKKYVSEFLGTFILVLFSCIIGTFMRSTISAVLIGTAVAYAAVWYSVGKISGCYLNPAVSLAMWLNRKISLKDMLLYIVAQIAGAFAACGVLIGVYQTVENNNSYKNFGFATSVYKSVGVIPSLIMSVVIAFIFVLVFVSVTSDEPKSIDGIVIGLVLGCCEMIGYVFTITSLNPARAIASAVLSGKEEIKQMWLFVCAPVIGAILAVVVLGLLNYKKPEKIVEEPENEISEEPVSEEN